MCELKMNVNSTKTPYEPFKTSKKYGGKVKYIFFGLLSMLGIQCMAQK